MIKKLLLLTSLLHSFLTFSQSELYIPLEFQKAYKNQTRSFDGRPGKNYWQNHSSYTIDVEVIPKSWKIIGKEQVVYTNNSNDSLSKLIIKTYPNHYKMGAVRDTEVSHKNLTEGMKLHDLIINGVNILLDDPQQVKEKSTFITVSLKEKLPPNDSLSMSINWESVLPLIYKNRIGAYDDHSAFMGYWYPQIAVYDDIDAWDEYEYLGTQEFYRDFANFDVRIKIPANYKVWATGTLTNKNEVFTKEVLKRLNDSKTTNNAIIIEKGGPYTDDLIGGYKTWIFNAKNVQDFAAGFSDNFRWETSTLKIKDKTIYSNLVYDPKDTTQIKNLLFNQNLALRYYSDSLPGIVYPYEQFTTFMGVPEADGMEFPMIANNGINTKSNDNNDYTLSTAAHELSHNYFPFYVGVNEVKYSWMEEGMARFLGTEFMRNYYENSSIKSGLLKSQMAIFSKNAGHQWETPLFGPTNHLVYRFMHSQMSYTKPAIMYQILMDMLGKKQFLLCYQTYIERWAEKRPTPFDFMFTFNDIANQDLTWFWRPWIMEFGYPDLAIIEVKESKVFIERIGNLPVPIDLKLTYKDEHEIILHRTANVWSGGDKVIEIVVDDFQKIKSVELLTEKSPDVDITNNLLKIKK